MRFSWTDRIVVTASAFWVGSVSPGVAQTLPWEVYEDIQSTSVCDLVNAENAELVVLADTGYFRTEQELIFLDTFVDLDGFVYFEGAPVGLIDFATDGDGFRTLWWTTLTGRVVHVNGFTGEPTPTDLVPSDFVDVPCDACEYWDYPPVCVFPDDGDVEPVPMPPITINFCGTNAGLGMALTAVGLGVMGLMRRRLA